MCKKRNCPIYKDCDKSKEQMKFCKETEREIRNNPTYIDILDFNDISCAENW